MGWRGHPHQQLPRKQSDVGDMPLCTECGTRVASTEGVCPRCRHPRWHTLRKVAICLGIVAALLLVIRYLATEFAGTWPG
jgi:hypothetical protein